MKHLLQFAFATVLVAGAASQLAVKLDGLPRAPADATAAAVAEAPTPAAYTGGVLSGPRGRNGHFHVEGTVSGRRVSLLVDTGASVVVLRHEDAARLGIYPKPRDFTARMSTANGVVEAAPVRLTALDLGPLIVRDVAAVVMPEGKLAESLLGMSFLSRLRRFEFRTGQLVLEQ